MDNQTEQLETLREIRSYMERSSRFLSLSGFSGVIIGLTAVAGIAAVYIYLGISPFERSFYQVVEAMNSDSIASFYALILVTAIIVLTISLSTAWMLTYKKSRQKGLPIYDASAKRLLINIFIPLSAGGIYSLLLFHHGLIAFIAPATIIFYGLALVNASKYAIDDLRYLGIAEIITGLIAAFAIDYGLLFWAFGFGILHIIYGITMYLKYEK